MALFGHSICFKDSFGRVCAACSAWPTCPAAGRVSNPSRSVSTQSRAAWEAAGWKAVREVHHMPCLQILLRFLLEGETAFGLIYISTTSVAAAYAEPWLVVRHGSTALVFPAAPTTPEHSAVSALLLAEPELHGNLLLHKLWVWKGLQGKASSLLFLSDCGQPARSLLKGKGMGGRYSKSGNIMK